MADAKFVRLRDSATHGMLADLESGWFISGYDVKEFPENAQQAKFVKSRLRSGLLEEAGQAEFDEAHPELDDNDLRRMGITSDPSHAVQPTVQEAQLRQRAGQSRAKLDEARVKARKKAKDEDEGEPSSPPQGRQAARQQRSGQEA